VRLGSDVAALCAVGLLIGPLGSGLTWWERSDLFDLASNSRQTVKMGLGYLAGPILILGSLATLTMWPRQLRVVRVDRNGMVRAVPTAREQPARSPTGP
jgi:hypothetical protein